MSLSSMIDSGAYLSRPFEDNSSVSLDYEITVVVVPDIGAPHEASAWLDGRLPWLTTLLPQLSRSPYLLEYRYSRGSGDAFAWDRLYHCGDRLLEQLIALTSDAKFVSRPLVLICHGVGGLVVKRAVGILHSQFYRNGFDDIIALLSGIVFMGSPHVTFDKPQEFSKLSLLLRASTKLTKKAIDHNAGQVSALAKICQTFNDSVTDTHILSAYEGKKTKVALSMISSKREVLVGQESCQTRLKKEVLVKVDATHHDICHVSTGSDWAKALQQFFATVEVERAQIAMRKVTLGPKSLPAWTATVSEASHSEEHPLSQDTNMATNQSSDIAGYEVVPLTKPMTNNVAKDLNLPYRLLKPYERDPNFYGRESTLEQIASVLSPPKTSMSSNKAQGSKTFALCGVGGVGKTSIAVEYAYANIDYFDAIFFLQASEAAKLFQAFSTIAVEIGLEGEVGDQVVSRDMVLGWLAEPVRQLYPDRKPPDESDDRSLKWLLVFDNADDLSVLQDFWPVSGDGSILITSRDPLAKTRTHVRVTNGIDLPPFTNEEAGYLLRDLTDHNTAEDLTISKTIAAKLSGLPLAITQIAGTIKRRELSLEEFSTFYDTNEFRADFHRTSLENSAKTLWTVWYFEELSSTALALLEIIAFLDPDQIPEQILMNMWNLEDFDQPKNFPSTVYDFVEARIELSKSSLVKRNSNRRELAVHRIVQDVTQAKMDEETLRDRYESAVNLIYITWPFSEFEHSTERWKRCEPVISHVANLYRLYNDNEILRTLEVPRSKLARIFMDFGWYYIERGNIPESLPYFELCDQICVLSPGDTRIWYGDKEGCLAQVASILGRTEEAIFHAQRSVDIFDEYDKYGWRLPQAHNELCEAFIGAGRWEESLVQANLAISGYLALPNEYPDWAMMNKGLAFCNLGRLDEASAVLEEFLAYQEATFGPMDTSSYKTGQAMLFLGNVRCAQSRSGEGFDLYFKALTQYFSTIGPNHFRVAALYHKIAENYISLEEMREASVILNKAMQIYGDNPNFFAQIARTAFLLGDVELEIGDTTKSSAWYQRAMIFLDKVSSKAGRQITRAKLEELIPNWSK